MQRKLILAVIALVLIFGLCRVAFADFVVGVKKGDWIEYTSTYTGNPGAGHDLTSARMEILDTSGTNISIQITARYPNGTSETSNAKLNLQTGHLIDAFIIPANKKAGDTFYDETLGNVTLTKAEQHVYAGATRTVVYGAALGDTYIWDQATGVCVEGTAQTSGYSMHSIIADTNMWQPNEGLNMAFVTLLAAISAVLALLVIAVALWFKRRRAAKATAK
jgi:hypothetical protein